MEKLLDTPSLFVYGSLQPGGPNADVLKALAGVWQPAIVKGFLVDAGWGAALGYPGLRLTNAGNQIRGMVFTSSDLPRFWQELDAFEGEQYERVLAAVTVETGAVIQAYVYALREPPEATSSGLE